MKDYILKIKVDKMLIMKNPFYIFFPQLLRWKVGKTIRAIHKNAESIIRSIETYYDSPLSKEGYSVMN